MTTDKEVIVVYKLEMDRYGEAPMVKVVRVFPTEFEKGQKSLFNQFLAEGVKHGVTDYNWSTAIMEEESEDA